MANQMDGHDVLTAPTSDVADQAKARLADDALADVGKLNWGDTGGKCLPDIKLKEDEEDEEDEECEKDEKECEEDEKECEEDEKECEEDEKLDSGKEKDKIKNPNRPTFGKPAA